MNKNLKHIVDELLEDPGLRETLAPGDSSAHWVSIEPVVGDQRRSYRYPAQPGQEQALLRRRGKALACELIEESAGGFALLVPTEVNLQVGEICEVQIYSGWYRARIVHTQSAEGGNRVGFERVAVVRSKTRESADFDGRRENWLSTGGGGKLLMIAVAIMLGTGLVLSVSGSSLFGMLSGNLTGGTSAQISPQFGRRPPNPQLISMLESVNMLTQPEVAKDLGLSPNQQKTLDGIFTGASNSLGELYEKSKKQSPEVWYRESQNIMTEALENILCSMTDAQVVKWRRLLVQQRKERLQTP